MNNAQQRALEKHSSHLAQLITRLSGFYEGIDKQIDSELATLRGHLAGKPNFTMAEVSIRKLSPLLLETDKNVRQTIKHNTSNLQTRLRGVQKLNQGDKPFEMAIAKTLSILSEQTTSIDDLSRHFFKVIDLLETALQTKTQSKRKIVAPNAEPTKEEKDDADDGLLDEILVELQQLVDVYSEKRPDDPQITELKQALEKGLDEQQLLESCLVLIRLIISETLLDASINGKAVNSIYQVIGKTHTHLKDSVEATKNQYQHQVEQRSVVKDMLDELNVDVDSDKDLKSLKRKVQEQISKIQKTLVEHGQTSEQDQTILMGLLEDMQSKLNTLQKQTQRFKRRLLEQRASIYTDTLTQLPNRMAYNERISKAIEYAHKQEETLSLVIIDVDHFKRINDEYGHAAGDRTLKAIGQHFNKKLHPNEFLARWGGEEFVLLIHNQQEPELLQRLELFRTSLSALPFKFKQTPVSISASFGVAKLNAADSVHSLFERADKALYEAKKQGRNCVVVGE